MKKIMPVVALGTAMALAGCSGSNTSNVAFDPDAMKFDINSDTGLCFAVSGSLKSEETFNFTRRGRLVMTWVPCTPEVLEKVPAESKRKTEKKGVRPFVLLSP